MKSIKSGTTAAARSTGQTLSKVKERKVQPEPAGPAARPRKVSPPAQVAAAIDFQPPSRYQEIKARAYLIWRKAGCPEGQQLAHWLEAEAQVKQSSNGSHPAIPRAHPAAPANGSRRRLLDLIIKA